MTELSKLELRLLLLLLLLSLLTLLPLLRLITWLLRSTLLLVDVALLLAVSGCSWMQLDAAQAGNSCLQRCCR